MDSKARADSKRLRILLLSSFAATACAPHVELAPALERLRGVDPGRPGQLKLNELDISGDGKLDALDATFFAQLASAAQAELAKRGERIDVLDRLYHGNEKDVPPVFQSLRGQSGQLDLATATTPRLQELAIEARWLAQRVRVAALAAPAPLNGRPFSGVLLSQIPEYNADAMDPAAVCRLIDALDVAPFHRAGVPAVALLDLDGTVWQGNVMDPFLAALVNLDLIHEDANPGLRKYLKTLKGVDAAAIDRAPVRENAQLLLDRWTKPEIPKDLRPSAKDMFYNIVNLMRGMTVEEADHAASSVFEAGARPFPPWLERAFADHDGCHMRTILEKLKARGIDVYLLSATLDVLAREGGRALGIPRAQVVGSLLEVRDGRYTGEVRDSAYYTKGSIVRQWVPSPPLLVFGDSPGSDFSMMLESAGVSFMVNPRPKLTARDAADAGSRFVALWFDGTEAKLPPRE